MTKKSLPPDLDGPTVPRPRDGSSGGAGASGWSLSSVVRQWRMREDTDGALPDELSPRYELKGLLGRGGMGEVHRARDRRLRRDVALKTARLDGKEVDAGRFLHEAQVTAQLAHPNIPPLHDLGVGPDGTVFFTMRALPGRPLGAILRDGGALPVGRALEVFGKVCDAVGYAHARGVLHRDLKPGNILVGEHGEVYVIDWGLARRLTDDAEVRTDADDSGDAFTEVGAVVGTPGYMSPEQLAGDVPLDVRADVYALGAVLYAMLVGRPPFAPGDGDLRLKVHRGEYVPLSRARRGVPWELDRVVARALATRREARYPDAVALHEDLRAFVEGRPLPGIRYPAWRVAARVAARWRRPLLLGAAGTGLVGTVVFGAVAFHAVTVTRARDRAVEAERETRLRSLDQDVALARLSARLGLLHEARRSLRGTLATVEELGADPRRARLALSSLDAAWPPPEVRVRWPGGPLGPSVLGPDDQVAFALPSDAGTVIAVHDLLTGARTHRYVLSPGRQLATLRFEGPSLALWVTDGDGLQRIDGLTGAAGPVTPLPERSPEAALRVSADGTRVALTDHDVTRVFALPGGEPVGPAWSGGIDHLSADGRRAVAHRPVGGQNRQITHYEWWDLDAGVATGSADAVGGGWVSPDLSVALVGDAAGLSVWRDGAVSRWADAPPQAWAESDGDVVVLAGIDGTVEERSLGTGALLRRRTIGEGRTPGSLGVSIADGWLAASVDGGLNLWSRVDLPDRIPAHDAPPLSLDLSPDGVLAATTTWSGEIAIWDWRARRVLLRFAGSPEGVRDASFAPDGRRLATADREGNVRVVDLVSGATSAPLADGHGLAMGVWWERDDRLWATYEDGAVVAWDPAAGVVAAVERGALRTCWNLEVAGGRAAVGGRSEDDAVGEWWDLATSTPLGSTARRGAGYGAAVSPDGTAVAFGTGDGTVVVVDAQGERELPSTGGGPVLSVAFTPDGSAVAAGTFSGRIFLLDRVTGEPLVDLEGHDDGVAEVTFVPGTWTLLSIGGTRAELVVTDLAATDAYEASALRLAPDADAPAPAVDALTRAELRRDWRHAAEALRRIRAEGGTVAPTREARALQGVGDVEGARRALLAPVPDPLASDGTRAVWAAALR